MSKRHFHGSGSVFMKSCRSPLSAVYRQTCSTARAPVASTCTASRLCGTTCRDGELCFSSTTGTAQGPSAAPSSTKVSPSPVKDALRLVFEPWLIFFFSSTALVQMGYNLSPQFSETVVQRFTIRGARPGIQLDRFIQVCTQLQSMTQLFREKDTSMTGNVRLSYEDFLSGAMTRLMWAAAGERPPSTLDTVCQKCLLHWSCVPPTASL